MTNIKKWDTRSVGSFIFFILMSFLILLQLGNYPLWDDEANTAIFAHGVWETGDTSAIFGNNILGYRNGLELNEELKNRLVAPLEYYVTAPFLGLLGNATFYLRLPFAIAGLLTLLIIIRWLFQVKASLKMHILVWLGFLGNVSFILYSRQCRYYSLVMLFSVLAAYFYLHKSRVSYYTSQWRSTVLLMVSLVLLMSSHYIAYAALLSVLVIDFLLWERFRHPFTRLQQLCIVISQVVACYCIVSIWYPLGKDIAQVPEHHWLLTRLKLLWLNFRDANSSEAVAGVIFLLAPCIYYLQKNRNPILLRLIVGSAILFIITSVFSPQPGMASIADVRFFAFALPFFIFLSIVTIENLPVKSGYQYIIAGFIFFTTFFNCLFAFIVGGPQPPLRSTLIEYVGELSTPPRIAYAVAAAWINKNTIAGETAFVWPKYSAYPLMYHAPQLIYGWQFDETARNKFPHLPAIQYQEQIMPDYIILFGVSSAERKDLFHLIKSKYHVNYSEVAHLAVSSTDQSRPEIFLHSFKEKELSKMSSDGVSIFKRNKDQFFPISVGVDTKKLLTRVTEPSSPACIEIFL